MISTGAVQTPAHTPAPDPAPLWELAFDASPNPMVVLDDERRVVRANRAASRLLRATPDALEGVRIDDFTPAPQRDCLADGWPDFLRAGSIVQRRAIALPGGHVVDIDYYATANVLPGRHLAVCIPDGDAGGELTPREREVVELLATGLSGARIAEQLVISRETVRTHVRNAMEKLGARTRPHLIAIALRDGLIRA